MALKDTPKGYQVEWTIKKYRVKVSKVKRFFTVWNQILNEQHLYSFALITYTSKKRQQNNNIYYVSSLHSVQLGYKITKLTMVMW